MGLTSVSRQFGDSIASFALRLFAKMPLGDEERKSQENLFLSPLAIAMTLAAMRRGASLETRNMDQFDNVRLSSGNI